LVIGEWVATQAPVLRMLDLRSKQLYVLPGSEGLFHPAWSPDGKYIAAASAQGRKETGWLYEVRTQQWTPLPVSSPCSWAHDSQALFCEGDAEPVVRFQLAKGNVEPAVVRLQVGTGKVEKVASLKGVRRPDSAPGGWLGLDPTDAPLVLRDTGSQQIYALDLQVP
jgi:Tol biopolymer transport system component